MIAELWCVNVCSYSKGRLSLSFGRQSQIGDGWRHLLIVRGRKWVRVLDPYSFSAGKVKVTIWDLWKLKHRGDWSVFQDLDANGLKKMLKRTAKRLGRPVPTIARELVR